MINATVRTLWVERSTPQLFNSCADHVGGSRARRGKAAGRDQAGGVGAAKWANAFRFSSDSPRDTRQAHSRRIARAEADLQHRVERLVGVGEHRAEQPVQLVRRDRVQRHPADQVDVADRVDGERDPVHAGVALQQPGPQLLAVLVRLAHHERLDAQRVLADDQVAQRLELVGAGQGDHVRRRRRSAPTSAPRSSSVDSMSDATPRHRAVIDDAGTGRVEHACRASASSWHGARTSPPGRPRAARPPYASRRSCGRARPRPGPARAAGPARSSSRRRDPGPVVRVVAVDQHAGDPVPDGGDQPADGRRHHRRAAGLRLQRDQPERLVVARHRDQVGGPVERGQVVAGQRRQEPHRSRRRRARRPARSARSAGPGRSRWGRRRSTTVSRRRPAPGRARAARRPPAAARRAP